MMQTSDDWHVARNVALSRTFVDNPQQWIIN